ncbi:MAG: amidohydrolase family protein [Exilibacterium sp.]
MKTSIEVLKMVLLLAAFTGVFPACAADLVITNAKVYTMSGRGILEHATVVVKDGHIKAIADVKSDAAISLASESGVEVIDAGGGSVTPGLINSDTHIGVEEISAIQETLDFTTLNTRITAALKVADAFNPASVLIPQNRIHGLTRALVMPESGSSVIAGQAAVVDLSASPRSVIDDSVAVVANLGEAAVQLVGGSRAAAMMLLREVLEDARDYSAHKQDFNRRQRRAYALSRLDLEALAEVVRGNKPMIVRVHRAADIRKVLAFAGQQKIKLVLAGAEEGWMLADTIAAAGVAVIIDPILNLPSSYESIGTRADNAALLHRAGVKLLFTGMGWQNTHNAYLVRQSAGNAVANGLPKAVALAAMSANPAAVFSLDDYGVLKAGAPADLVLWDGDPLDVTSEAQVVLINGERVPLVSRSTRLAQRYYQRLRQTLGNP